MLVRVPVIWENVASLDLTKVPLPVGSGKERPGWRHVAAGDGA